MSVGEKSVAGWRGAYEKVLEEESLTAISLYSWVRGRRKGIRKD